MLKDNVVVIGLLTVGILLIGVVTYYMFGDISQNTKVQGINETARVAVTENMDNSSRVNRGELFLDDVGFEESFNNKIKEVIGKGEEVDAEFDYLKRGNGTVKAVKIKVKEGSDTYQTTLMVDIAEN